MGARDVGGSGGQGMLELVRPRDAGVSEAKRCWS